MTGFWSALAVVFVAELGDKTQLVALGFGARYRLSQVLAGMLLAYVVASALSVGVGAAAGEVLPDTTLRIAGGVLFLGFALWALLDHDDDDDVALDDAAVGPASVPAPRVIASVAVAMFVAELGDKTMLATATLASTSQPIAVFVGALLGIFAAGTVGALIGRMLGDRLPVRIVRIGSAVLFAAFGVALLVSAT